MTTDELDLIGLFNIERLEEEYVREQWEIKKPKELNALQGLFGGMSAEISHMKTCNLIKQEIRLEFRRDIIRKLLLRVVSESEKVEDLNKKIESRVVDGIKVALATDHPIKTTVIPVMSYDSPSSYILTRRIRVMPFEMVYFIDNNLKKEDD